MCSSLPDGPFPEIGSPRQVRSSYRPVTDETYYTELLRPLFAGRPVLVTGGPVAGLVPLARSARALGAARVFVLGSEGTGAGPLHTPEEAEWLEWLALDVSATSILEGIRAGQRRLADLPQLARDAIERFDPDRRALVVATFLNELPEVAGRPCLAFRRPAWVALEDKLVADELWDRAGVERTPAVVVPAERIALGRAARSLDQGAGTVWAADSRNGYNGGAEGLRWVRDEGEADEAASFLAGQGDRARVMPFLEGVPCSIHGLVFDDYVAALRPVEMVTLRPERGPSLFYAGVASYWDPPAADRAAMQDVARRVGARLRSEVAFRGPFTVDGVLTADGFRPTELNPRAGAGVQVLAKGLVSLPLHILNAAISAQLSLDFRPADLERLLVTRADGDRAGGTWRAVPGTAPEIVDQPVVGDERGYRWAEGPAAAGPAAEGPAAEADGWVTAAPWSVGAFVRLSFNGARTPIGPSVARRAVAFYRFTDAALGTRIGPLRPAREVR